MFCEGKTHEKPIEAQFNALIGTGKSHDRRQ
ncbi:MAG: hypothetical protein ACJAR2_001201 [Ilumatobacter sp.]|jgi:hypothetical protein